MSEVNKKWFQDAFADRRTSQNAFAKKIGMDTASLSLLLDGKREFTLDKAARIARGLGVSLDDVLVHTGIDISTNHGRHVPILGFIDGESRVDLLDEPSGIVTAPDELETGSCAFVMRTTRTGLDMMDGWIAFAGPQADAPDTLDRTYVLKPKGAEQAQMRVVRRGASARKFMLIGIHQPVTYDAEIEWVRPLLLFRPI